MTSCYSLDKKCLWIQKLNISLIIYQMKTKISNIKHGHEAKTLVYASEQILT